MTAHPPDFMPPQELDSMSACATDAAAFLKTMAHEGRLMILCNLCNGERSVSELEEILQIRQAAVSQMLARLRDEELVSTRREGKAVFYSLADDRTKQMISLLHDLFGDHS